MRVDQEVARKCYERSLRSRRDTYNVSQLPIHTDLPGTELDNIWKLMEAEHIREIQYPDWLANVVVVKMANGKWRMCVDFTDLNLACPKDSYPLPNIDVLVDRVSGCGLLSFVDAYSGYNQIRMHHSDEDKTVFMGIKANFCYKVMPFGLKNAGATYQRMMDKILQPMLGQNVESYVDDMVVTSVGNETHALDL